MIGSLVSSLVSSCADAPPAVTLSQPPSPPPSVSPESTLAPSESSPLTPNNQDSSGSSTFFIASLQKANVETFLQSYHELINQGQYEQAWNQLSDDVQAQQSYSSYVEWWASVGYVTLHHINHGYIGETGSEAIVLVSYDQGRPEPTYEALYMSVRSPSTGINTDDRWLIDIVQPTTLVPPQQILDPSPLTNDSVLSLDGIGPIRVGMTIQAAANATGLYMASRDISAQGASTEGASTEGASTEGASTEGASTEGASTEEASTEGCAFYQALGGPDDILFMTANQQITRIDVIASTIETRSGAHVGSSTVDIQAMYPGKIEISGHKYTNGNYLTFVPQDPTEQQYRMIFETDESGIVQRFRSGQLPEVGYVEGCS